MKALLPGNLKTRLFLLILFAFIPAFGLAFLGSLQRLHAQQAEQQDNALRLVHVMEASHRELLAEASALLQAVSRLSLLGNLSAAQCQDVVRDLMQSFPRFHTFGLAAPNGDVYCSAQPARLKGNIAHLRFFRDAVTTRMPASGPYEMDALLNKAVVYIGVPVMDASGQIAAVSFAAFDLSGFSNWAGALRLPSDSIIVMFDQAGLILARYHDAPRWTGSYQPQAPIVQYAKRHGEDGVTDLIGATDVERLFAYATIHRTVDQTVFLGFGITADTAYASARQGFRYDMFSLALACVLVLGIAWIGSDVLIVNKLRLLIHAADRIRRGDLHVRSGLKAGGDEAAQLAGAIDSMAQAIESRVEALLRHGEEMRQLRDMNDALQACVTHDEVYAVVRQCLQQLFPGRAGALYMLGASGDHFAVVAQWQEPASELEFLPDDCWAVRRGKPYRVDSGGQQIRCRHVQEPPPFSYLCVPLLVQGEIIGVLHLEHDHGFPSDETEPGSQALAAAAADHAGLRLAHIRLRDNLHDQAMRDGLTGLFNRRYMEETLLRETRNARRNKSVVAIIMLDIDHFKRFNDSFGHAAGDALLRGIGRMLQTQMRGGDLACRYGGEEFTIILPNTDLRQAGEIAEKLRQKTRTLRIEANGAAVGEVTISLGVALYPQHGETWEDVLHAADMALLQAKQTRDCSVIFES